MGAVDTSGRAGRRSAAGLPPGRSVQRLTSDDTVERECERDGGREEESVGQARQEEGKAVPVHPVQALLPSQAACGTGKRVQDACAECSARLTYHDHRLVGSLRLRLERTACSSSAYAHLYCAPCIQPGRFAGLITFGCDVRVAACCGPRPRCRLQSRREVSCPAATACKVLCDESG